MLFTIASRAVSHTSLHYVTFSLMMFVAMTHTIARLYASMLSLCLFYILLCMMAHLMSNISHYRRKWMLLSGLVRGRQISWHFSDEGMFYPPPPASKYASIQCAIYCLIWLPSLQHVCPGAGEIGNKSFACISCLFDPAALFCLMKLDFNSKCHSQSWQSLLFWSITRVLSEKHSGFSDYFSKKKKKVLLLCVVVMILVE